MSGNDANSPEVTVVEVPDIPELKDAVWKEDILPSPEDSNALRIKFLDARDCPVVTPAASGLPQLSPGCIDNHKRTENLCAFSHGGSVAVVAQSNYGQLFLWLSSDPSKWLQLPFLPNLESKTEMDRVQRGCVVEDVLVTVEY